MCLDHGLCWRFLGTGRRGVVNDLGLARLNYFTGLWSVGVARSCVAPGPRRIRVEEYCSQVQGQVGEAARRGIASWVRIGGGILAPGRLVGLSQAGPFALSENWLPQEGPSP